jgi:hypothetical protein
VAAGDLDGDGYDELIVSASESWGGVFSQVYVLRGGPGAHGSGSVDLATTPAAQTIRGAELVDNLGASIATGDVNGDGVDDLLLCASLADFGGIADRGIAYLIYGGPAFFTLGMRDLSLAGTWDLRVIGPVAAGDMGGSNSFGGLDAQGAAIGRLDADAYGDIVLGVHLADGYTGDVGRVYAVWGGPFPSGFTINLSAGGLFVRIDGAGQYDELGTVVRVGDLTGDGIDELICGNEYASKGLFTTDGAVYIFRGRPRAEWPTTWTLHTLPADITLLGWRNYDELGASVAVGDVDGDGLTDLVASAPGAEFGTLNTQRGDGFVYGLRGSLAYQSGTFTIDYATAMPDFLLVGEPEENLGVLLAAGDFDADGLADIAAAEWFAGPATNGAVEVLYGRAFAPGAIYTATVDTDLRILGAPNDRISFSLGAADMNNDGLAEVVFGTPFNNSNRGTVYVFTHVTGDGDHDRDVDLHDFAILQGCLAPSAGAALGGPCPLFDFTLDELVAEDDWLAFAERLAGPAQP